MQYSLDFFAMKGVKVTHIKDEDYNLNLRIDKEPFEMIIKGCLDEGFDVAVGNQPYVMLDYTILESKRGLVTVDILGVKL